MAATFFDIIQAYFTRLTGRFMMFSGRDMELLQGWRDQGATAASICRGIREAVLHMEQERPPRSLYNCRDFITPYVERARSRRVGERARVIDVPAEQAARQGRVRPRQSAAARALETIERAGARCQREEVRELYRRAWYQVRALADELDIDRLYSALLDLEESLAEEYLETLTPRQRERLEARLVDEARALSARMSEEAWRSHLAARRRYLLTREHGLVALLE